jgi:hypothetical protein
VISFSATLFESLEKTLSYFFSVHQRKLFIPTDSKRALFYRKANMKKSVITFIATLALSLALSSALAQKKDKPWTEWSKQDAEKVLSDSPWAHTQTDTETSQRLYSRNTSDPTTTSRLSRGAINQEINIRFHVRFFSARPVRQGLARLMQLDQKPSAEVVAKLHSFAEMKSAKSIIVTLSFDSNDPGYFGSIMQALSTANTSILKNNTYLERSDGKRLFLEEYVAPGKDGFGARFVFPREFNGPFLNPDSGELRFHAEYPTGLEIDRRFKVADMVYNGELEY